MKLCELGPRQLNRLHVRKPAPATCPFPTVDDGSKRFAGEQEGFVYSRVGSPTTVLLEQRIADLEHGEAAPGYGVGNGRYGVPNVRVCHYPGLKTFPQLELAQRQMVMPGGMVAFEFEDGFDVPPSRPNHAVPLIGGLAVGP